MASGIDPKKQNELARRLRALHVPGNPVVFTNVYDAATAAIAAAHPGTKALATASFAVAATNGIADNDLSRDDNLAAIAKIAAVAASKDLPLTADLQDGYADASQTIQNAIALGVVGCNLEDVNNSSEKLRSKEEAVGRVKQAVAAAKAAGVPDFCVNARTDVLSFGGSIEDAVDRGKAYLNAGAVTVFIWGGPSGRGVSTEEVKKLVEGLGGMINVKMNLRPGFLTRGELANVGVARISVGPELFRKAMAAYKEAMANMLELKTASL